MRAYRGLPLALLLVLLTACGAAIPTFNSLGTATRPATIAKQADPVAPARAPMLQSDPFALEDRLQTLYDQVSPSVVHIQTTGRILQFDEAPDLPFEAPDVPFRFDIPSRGQGSGFVWDEAGHIVTNDHVVDDAERIRVTFADGSVSLGQVVGRDPDSDLAVVKVDSLPENARPLTLARTTPRVGQLAVAIGNPFGQSGTMTVGFVSAVERLLPTGAGLPGGRYSIPDVIQTDAAINPGNSGGVLVDRDGQVIGVTTAILSPSGVSSGVGFAIPATLVSKVIPQLISEGSFAHPWLGISGVTLTPELAEAMGLDPEQRGALVVDVLDDSPSAEAGLVGSDRTTEIDGLERAVGGDVIVEIDGDPVTRFDDLVAYLAREGRVGATIPLVVLRDGERVTVELTLAERPEREAPDTPPIVRRFDRDPGDSEQPFIREFPAERAPVRIGVGIRPLTPEIAEAMGLDPEQEGLLIQSVDPDSPAARAGLRGSDEPLDDTDAPTLIGGDVIVAAGGEPIATFQALLAVLRDLEPGDELDMVVLRDGDELSLTVTVDAWPDE